MSLQWELLMPQSRRRGRAQPARATLRNTVREAEGVVRSAVDESDQLAENVADVVARTADSAADITRRVADQGREVIWLGMRAAAGMNGRLADVGIGGSHRVLEQASRVVEIYSQASAATADNLRLMFNAYLSLTHGLQQTQHTWLSLLDATINDAAHKPQDMLRCTSMVDFANAQRELYVNAVERAVEASATLLQLGERVAREAVAPLREKARTNARA
jgi:hypothetical protein